MIKVTRLGTKETELAINADLIELVEATPDTVITLTTGNKLLVRESVDEIIHRVIAYRRETQPDPARQAGGSGAAQAPAAGGPAQAVQEVEDESGY
ncbi:MAG: flagellar FlbD family protein [Symbiobacteriia bacterium]